MAADTSANPAPSAAPSAAAPSYGNSRKDWNAGERFGFDANPEYR